METTEIIAELRKVLSVGDSPVFCGGTFIPKQLAMEAADRLEYLNGLVSEWEAVVHGQTYEPVVHAHWVKLTPDQRDYFTDYTHCCSKCGEWGKKHYKRCRECGAVMDEKMPPEPTPLIRLDLGGRINKRLKQMGVTTVEQLEAMDKHTLHNIPGLGRRSIETIETELRIWNRTKEKNDG